MLDELSAKYKVLVNYTIYLELKIILYRDVNSFVLRSTLQITSLISPLLSLFPYTRLEFSVY